MFENTCVRCHMEAEVDSQLQVMGQEGWELVSAVQHNGWHLFFRRTPHLTIEVGHGQGLGTLDIEVLDMDLNTKPRRVR